MRSEFLRSDHDSAMLRLKSARTVKRGRMRYRCRPGARTVGGAGAGRLTFARRIGRIFEGQAGVRMGAAVGLDFPEGSNVKPNTPEISRGGAETRRRR